ncbi:LysR family transcriptional regulator substrate-binding protein [Streptomyces sp. CB01881]|uniref:LysR family transcriptional regulator substrate-binding protein n=1 Tax=Streptomyces sp. CB01881 TaxID=2078691 RepID=UPI000CDC352C|nr:LysR family transcriptional regulator substrate-binding protein [Streptomyces sp. CB01881]AUY49174.1 transcriptional regulator [Streptomyces sp. CB01881]TYC77664.1 LysR family transcriptional regulator [Streptomyces sp. CB01881]
MASEVNLAQLRALIAVADAGGFGAAASELGISQSAVSHAVAALERTLGAPVLHRTAPARPTPLGEQILPHARTAVASAAAVRTIATRHSGGLTGTVRLAAPTTVCQGLLPGLLRDWRAAHPRLTVSVFEGEDDELAVWLEAGTVDAAVLVDADPVPPGSVALGADSMHALLRRDHPLAGEPAVDVADLEDDDFLLSEGGCERHIREAYRRAGVRFAPRHRIRDLNTLIGMVHAGVGVSVMPALAQPMLPADCVLVPIRPAVHRSLTLTGPGGRPWSPAVNGLLAAVRSARS